MMKRIQQLPVAEKKELARGYAQVIVAETGFVDRIILMASFWDLIWMLFAVVTVWRMGNGSRE